MKRLILQILLFPIMPCFGKDDSNEIPETQQDYALAEKAVEELQIYREQYQPAMKQLIGEMYFGPETEERVAGQTNADLMQKSGATTPKIDPSSGRVISGFTVEGENATDVASNAMVKSRQGVRDIRAKGLEALAEIGRQGSTDANVNMAAAAKNATAEAMGEKEAEVAGNNAVTSAIGSAAGLGIYAMKDKKKEGK